MATEKKITSRIQQKHDVAANWAKATNFIPKKGEIIIYDAEYNASGEETQAVRFKIGDGSKTVNNLPFAVIDYSSDVEALKRKVANNSTAIGVLQENTVPKTRKINNKALSSDITLGAADVGVTEAAFPGLNKTGTVTAVRMNGETKNPASGVVDLGNVVTDVSGKQDKITSSNKLSASLVSGLATVAISGSYNDLSNKPTIPTVNNGTLTIQKNGTKVQTFTANQSSSVTANITVPTKVSELTNDSGYTTNKGTVTSVSVKMNGASKGTVTSSGTIDLGTVLTAHQDISGKQDKITSSNKLAASLVSGLSAVATSGSYNDLSNKPTIPDVSGKANLSGGNTFTGDQTIQNSQLTVVRDSAQGSGYIFDTYDGNVDASSGTILGVYQTGKDAGRVIIGDDSTAELTVGGNAGTSGQVLTSQGAGKTPIWKELVTLDTIQDITGNKTFTTSQSGGPKIGIYNGRLSVRSSSTSEGSIIWDTPSDNIAADFKVDENGAHLGLGVDAAADIVLNGDSGTAGQVLTSQGANRTPIWANVSGGSSDNSKHGYTQLTNEDLNTITEAGWYRAASGNTCTNRPSEISNNSFFLNVEKLDDTSVKQEIYVGLGYVSSHTRNGQSAYSGGTLDWSGWSSDMKISGFAQTFSGRKTFSSGINLTNSLQVEGSNGTSGQVLTSQGAGKAPQWKSMPTYTLSGTTLTITLP